MTPADRLADRLPEPDPVLTGEEAEALRIVLVPSNSDLNAIERGYRTRVVIADEVDVYPDWQREWGGLC